MEKCNCTDPGCPWCHGCCTNRAELTVYRIDMEDRTGTDMCEHCADDALESGVFELYHEIELED